MIWQEDATVFDANGEKVPVKLTHVDAEKWVGCGIRVSSVGESRNPANRFT